jgi:hypothetical protein
MENYYNKNISYLSEVIRCDLEEQYHKLSKYDINKYFKNYITEHIRYLLGESIYDFLVEIDYIMEGCFFLMVYDMDRITTNVFYNYDFEKNRKIKERKIKIQEILLGGKL